MSDRKPVCGRVQAIPGEQVTSPNIVSFSGRVAMEEAGGMELRAYKEGVKDPGVQGRPGGAGPSWNSSRLVVFLADLAFTQTVVNLLSTAAWRGVWNLWDLYLYYGLLQVLNTGHSIFSSIKSIMNMVLRCSSKLTLSHTYVKI